MKFTIRKYEKEGWQIWNTEYEPTVIDKMGESKFFLVAVFRYLFNLDEGF